jgi:hypothetical protein
VVALQQRPPRRLIRPETIPTGILRSETRVSRRAFLRASAVVGLGMAALPVVSACSSPTRDERFSALAAGLTSTLTLGDLSGFRGWFENEVLAARWAQNLPAYSEVGFTALDLTDTGGTLRVTWRAPHDTAAARHDVGVGLSDPGSGRLLIGSVTTTPRPVWTDEPIAVATRADATLLSGDGVPAAEWLTAAVAAVADVKAQCPPALAAGWTESLVVVVPQRLATFAHALGVGEDAYRDVAAVSWAEQPPGVGPMRVYVNHPLCRSLAAIDRRVLLAHESTHVATRLTLPQAPHWLSEGFAERVGLSASPGHRARNVALARAYAAKASSPPDLPVDAAFEPGAGADLATVYALSEQAVGAVFAEAGESEAVAFCLALGRGALWPIPRATVTSWYRSRLAGL